MLTPFGSSNSAQDCGLYVKNGQENGIDERPFVEMGRGESYQPDPLGLGSCARLSHNAVPTFGVPDPIVCGSFLVRGPGWDEVMGGIRY